MADIIVDSFWNWITGLGGAGDRTKSVAYQADPPLSDQLLTELYNNDLAQTIVDTYPEQAFRLGYSVEGADAVYLSAERKRLDVDAKLENVATWARLYGGAALWIGDDSSDASLPRIPGPIRWIEVVDKRYLSPNKTDYTAGSPNYGRPQTYNVNLAAGPVSTEVHASRLIRFGGRKTDQQTLVQRQYWDLSVLQSCWEPLQHFDTVIRSGGYMLSEAVQGVLKMSGFLDSLIAPDQTRIRTRLALFNIFRGLTKTITLDADSNESYERQAINMAGVGDINVMAMHRLAAAAHIPVSRLFGQAAAGLNATGDADIRYFYDQIQKYRTSLESPMTALFSAILAQQYGPPVDIGICWPPLWQEPPKDRAATEATQAQADQIYIQNDVLTPEEVSQKRFGIVRPAPIHNAPPPMPALPPKLP